MALSLPTLPAGHKMLASEYTQLMNAITQAYGVPLIQASDQVVNNSTAFVDITNFTTSVLASTTYRFDGVWFYSAATAADLKVSMISPVGSTALWEASSALSTDAVAGGNFFNGGFTEGSVPVFGGAGTTQKMVARVTGTLTTAGNAGTFKFRMAQNTADVSDCTLFAKSSLTVWQI